MKEKISWKIVAIILVPILLVLALCGIAVSCEEEDENKIPNMWAHPERWWVEFGEGHAVKHEDRKTEIPFENFTQCEMTCPQGVMNLADIQKEKNDLVITYSGYYGDSVKPGVGEWTNYLYYPELKVYYNSNNQRMEPYYIGMPECSRYIGSETQFEKIKNDNNAQNWTPSYLRRSGVFQVKFYPYTDKSAWYLRTKRGDFDFVLTAYVIIENKRLVEVQQ